MGGHLAGADDASEGVKPEEILTLHRLGPWWRELVVGLVLLLVWRSGPHCLIGLEAPQHIARLGLPNTP